MAIQRLRGYKAPGDNGVADRPFTENATDENQGMGPSPEYELYHAEEHMDEQRRVPDSDSPAHPERRGR